MVERPELRPHRGSVLTAALLAAGLLLSLPVWANPGDLDSTFGPGGPDGDGVVTTNIATVSSVPSSDSGRAIVIQSDNKILVGGSSDAGSCWKPLTYTRA